MAHFFFIFHTLSFELNFFSTGGEFRGQYKLGIIRNEFHWVYLTNRVTEDATNV